MGVGVGLGLCGVQDSSLIKCKTPSTVYGYEPTSNAIPNKIQNILILSRPRSRSRDTLIISKKLSFQLQMLYIFI